MCIMSVNNAMRAGRVRTKKKLRDKYGVGWSKKDLIKLLEKEDYDKYLEYVVFSRL
jgi:hypothetical protein